MIRYTALSATLLAITSLILLDTGLVETARADKTEAASSQQATEGRMLGKVTQVIDAAGYTYAEVDNGKEKVWAAGPVSPLKAGDEVFAQTMHALVDQAEGRGAVRIDVSMARAARRVFEERFSPGLRLEKTLAVYENMLP